LAQLPLFRNRAWSAVTAGAQIALASGRPRRETEGARRCPSMQVELRPIATIRPYENNPRINDQAVDVVAASIREFGFRQPIVVDVDGVIIVGHVRYKASLKLGLQKVPVHVAKDLTPDQIKAYRIGD